MAKTGRGWHGESDRHSQAAQGIKTVVQRAPGVSKSIPRKWQILNVKEAVSYLDASLQPPESSINSNLREAKKFLELSEGWRMGDHRVLRAIEQIEWALKAEDFDFIEHVLQAKKELAASLEQQTFEIKWNKGKPSYVVAFNAAGARKLSLAHLSNLGLDSVQWKILDIRVAPDKLAGRGELQRY